MSQDGVRGASLGTSQGELARITCYNDLVEAFAARKAELQLSDATLDDVAGLTPGHTGKVLGPAREKGIGPSVLEALMMALAVDLVMVPSPTKLAEMQPYYDGRKRSHVRTNHRVGNRGLSRVMRELGRKSVSMLGDGQLAEMRRKGGKNATAKLTPEQRCERARLAARVRWARAAKAREAGQEHE